MTIRSQALLRRTAPVAGFCFVAFSSIAAQAACGDPNGDGKVSAADALFTLRASVGQITCDLDVCDVDSNGRINVTDALKVLKSATGQVGAFACVSAAKTPADPFYAEQWGPVYINAPQVWSTRTDCSSVIVSVVDSGIDYYHDDLSANLWRNPGEIPHNNTDDDNNGFKDDVYGWDFFQNDQFPWDVDGHGTHVAGIIGARSNSTGVVGVCWNAQIMAVRFLDDFGNGFISDALQAIDYSRKNGAKVINNSWGGGGFDSGLYFSFKAASDDDISLVVAAGNDSINTDLTPDYPGQFLVRTQINVAAIEESGELSDFSNFGPTTVHVAAPGSDILSTIPYDSYEYFDGTSMASPFVAGSIALLRAQFPGVDAATLKNIVMTSAEPNVDIFDRAVADGTLDLQAAFQETAFAASSAGALKATSPGAGESAPVSVSGRRTIQRYADPGKKYSKLERAMETYTNGTSRAVTMVADHVVVELAGDTALANLQKEGFRVRRRLATDRLTVLVEAPVSVEETESRLKAVAGVNSVNPDYLVTAR